MLTPNNKNTENMNSLIKILSIQRKDVLSFYYLMLNYIVTTSFSLVITMILANALSKENFGIYRFVLAVIPITSLFALPALDIVLMKYASRGEVVNLNNIIWTKFIYGTYASLILLAFYFIYTLYPLNIPGFELLPLGIKFEHVIITLILTTPLYKLFYTYNYYLKGIGKLKQLFIYELVSGILKFAGLMLVLLHTHNGLLISIFAIIIATFIDFVIYKKVHNKMIYEDDNSVKNNTNKLIDEGKFVNTPLAYTTVATNIDKILIGMLFGPSILASYTIITLTATQASGFINQTLNQLIFVKISDTKKKIDAIATIRQSLVYIFILLLAIYTVAWVVFPHLFKSYAGFLDVLIITFPLALSMAMLDLVWFKIVAKRASRLLNYMQVFRMLLYIILVVIIYTAYNILTLTTKNIISYTIIGLTIINFLIMYYGLKSFKSKPE